MCQNIFIPFCTCTCAYLWRSKFTHKLNVINASKMKFHQIYRSLFFRLLKEKKYNKNNLRSRYLFWFFYLTDRHRSLSLYLWLYRLQTPTQWKLLFSFITTSTHRTFPNYSLKRLLIVCAPLWKAEIINVYTNTAQHATELQSKFVAFFIKCVCMFVCIEIIWLYTLKMR